jgi:hypothetical protein
LSFCLSVSNRVGTLRHSGRSGYLRTPSAHVRGVTNTFRFAADGRTTRAAAGHMAINATWPRRGASAEYPARKNPTIREKNVCPFILILPWQVVLRLEPIFSACAATITQPCRPWLACAHKPHNARYSASAHCAELELAEAVPDRVAGLGWATHGTGNTAHSIRAYSRASLALSAVWPTSHR